MTTEIDPQPYHRRDDEPGLWHERFTYYMELGPGRSIARCYREIINQQRARDGRPLLPTSASVPKVWRDRARQFDWQDRADAWDREQKRRQREQVEHVRALARKLAEEAIQVLKQTMRGELKNPDGTLTEGQNCTQRRLAAEKILDLAGVAALEPAELNDDGETEIIGIRILDQMSREEIKQEQLIQQPLNVADPQNHNGGRPADQKQGFWSSDDL